MVSTCKRCNSIYSAENIFSVHVTSEYQLIWEKDGFAGLPAGWNSLCFSLNPVPTIRAGKLLLSCNRACQCPLF